MTTTARTDPRTYRFGTFTLDASTGALSRDGRAVALTAQPTRMLLYLVRHAGRLVVREELIEHLWPDRVVEYDQGLAFCVRRIRAVLGDRARAPVFLETVPGQGYRFVAPVARTGGRSRRWADRRRLRTVLAMCLSGLAGAVLSAALASPPADEPATRPWLATALPAAADGPAAAARATHQIGGEYYRRNPDLRAARFAADLFEHAATLDTLFVEAHAMHAVARATLSWEFGGGAELDRARDALSRAMRLDSGAPATRLAEGYLRYYGERDYSGALEALADARSGAPTLPDPVVGRAYVLRRQGHWREALSDLEYALELDPRRFETLFALAMTHQMTGRYTAAVRYWRRATALSPSVAASYAHFAQVPLLAAGDYQGAVHLLRMGIERGNHVEVARGARRIAPVVARFDPAAARDVWFGVGEAAPRDLLARAQILTTWGERDAARATFDSLRVVLLDHGDEGPAVHAHEGWRDAYLAVAEAGIGEPKRAIRRARRAVARLPVERDAYVGPEWLILLATTYTMTGDHAAAIETLEAVLSAPAMLSPALLRLDPTWDPLRSHPRFRALADEPDPTLATEQGG